MTAFKIIGRVYVAIGLGVGVWQIALTLLEAFGW